ncbi:adenylate/guanylate cyclase domain-containing protein [Rhizobiaceae bacterium n13]|uniref:Adenylate/guanylate cyclase domain-containing protein n=1 Tax=Ferirhizobium litorale TaxID=2927786 RepID=A0AAE3U4D4_9HYPH|nr:adenylate/guanylate cyclase domain-containing protein [Fererhizobium litorale]MDI7864502.1 adenylate/guanylate cyclase domain-containing protein [Fererhizobium litorale]MDI7924747.1 adenylate/guanylate cyclase domain-containing protein [Fererhizobium litorale]
MDQYQINSVNDWLLDQGLRGLDETSLISGFCARLRNHGIDIIQAVIYLDTLHPVQEARGFIWDADTACGLEQRVFSRSNSDDNAQRWSGGPFHYMLQVGLSELHLPLDYDGEPRFNVLRDLGQEGHTDYFALIHQMSDDAIGEMDGIYSRWSTSRPGGFTVADLDALRKLAAALALAIKSAALRRIANSLVEVYLGRDPGQRVLEGRIARGTVESIHTVLWYSDMANYTSLSETVHSSELIAMLNDYSEAVISAVYAAGGDVLKLIGDGTLAIFNHADPKQAAAAALRARADLQARIAALNTRRESDRLATTSVYLALHVGEVFYGNIGSDERLDFTVVGPAVNEVCRMSAKCREIGRSFVLSDDIVSMLSGSDRDGMGDIGLYQLKGVSSPKRLYSPIVEQSGSIVPSAAKLAEG